MEFEDNKLNVAQMMISIFDSENHGGERKKCWFPTFSHFSAMF